MNKIWLHLICQDELDDITQLTENIHFLLEGIVATCHSDPDSPTAKLLESRKGNGKIIYRKWSHDFDLSRNLCLREGVIKHGDWILILDAPERVNPEFIIKLKSGLLDDIEKQGIKTIYQRSKPVLVRYTDSLYFIANPHTGLQGAKPGMADLSETEDFKEDSKWVFSLRDPVESWVKASKYYTWGRSNHCYLVYEPQRFPNHPRARDLANDHEQVRQSFLTYCSDILSFECTQENLTEYMKDTSKWSEKFIEFCEYEKILKNFYRYYVLKESAPEIFKTEEQWSIKEYLKGKNESKNLQAN